MRVNSIKYRNYFVYIIVIVLIVIFYVDYNSAESNYQYWYHARYLPDSYCVESEFSHAVIYLSNKCLPGWNISGDNVYNTMESVIYNCSNNVWYKYVYNDSSCTNLFIIKNETRNSLCYDDATVTCSNSLPPSEYVINYHEYEDENCTLTSSPMLEIALDQCITNFNSPALKVIKAIEKQFTISFFNDTDCTGVHLAVQRTAAIGECFLGSEGRYVKFGYYDTTRKKLDIISQWWFWFSIVGGLLLLTGVIILISIIFYRKTPAGYKKLLADHSTTMFDDNF